MNVTGHEARIIQARQGWTITRDNGATILSRRSPLGERFSVRAEDDETIRQAVRRHAVGFDPASHVRDLIREPRPDWPGHADIGALTADARAIQTMIRRLDHALTTDPTGDERRELRESACAQFADYWRSIARGKAPATTGRETRRAVLDHMADALRGQWKTGRRERARDERLESQSPLPLLKAGEPDRLIEAHEYMLDMLWPDHDTTA